MSNRVEFNMKRLILVLGLALSLIIPIAMGALEIPEPSYNAVTPDEGPLYSTKPAIGLEDLSVYSYTYLVDLGKVKESSKSQDPLYLQIYNPETNNWINTSIDASEDGKEHPTMKGVIQYKVDSAKFGDPFLGLSKFRFIDAKGNALKDANNGDPIEFSGPRIVVNLKDEKYKKEPGGSYSYSVLARSEATVAIGLRGTLDRNNWVWIGSPFKSSSEGWTKLEWKNVPYYRVVEFKIFE